MEQLAKGLDWLLSCYPTEPDMPPYTRSSASIRGANGSWHNLRPSSVSAGLWHVESVDKRRQSHESSLQLARRMCALPGSTRVVVRRIFRTVFPPSMDQAARAKFVEVFLSRLPGVVEPQSSLTLYATDGSSIEAHIIGDSVAFVERASMRAVGRCKRASEAHVRAILERALGRRGLAHQVFVLQVLEMQEPHKPPLAEARKPLGRLEARKEAAPCR